METTKGTQKTLIIEKEGVATRTEVYLLTEQWFFLLGIFFADFCQRVKFMIFDSQKEPRELPQLRYITNSSENTIRGP